ncbi:retention module-containing protein, partial [Gammaproteobacteria bacterium AS21]
MIIGRVTFLIGKAIVVSLDGSSRELRLGDSIDSTETIEVSAGGEVVITDNNGVAVSIGGNESWAAQNGQFNELPEVESSEIDTSTIDPTSVEAIQAALLAGIDPTTIGEATAAGNQGGGDQQLGSEGSSFVRVGRGNTSSIDSGLDFDTIAQGANTLENSVFDTLLRAESSEPTGPFTGLSSTPPLTGFTAFDDVDSNGLAGSREVISNNSFTNDSTPIYSGSSTPGSIIRIYDNNVLVTTTTVDADGNWQIQSPELEDAVHSITVTAQQEGSTESAPNGPLNFTVDTSAPTQTAVISNVYDDVNGLSDIASGGATDDT